MNLLNSNYALNPQNTGKLTNWNYDDAFVSEKNLFEIIFLHSAKVKVKSISDCIQCTHRFLICEIKTDLHNKLILSFLMEKQIYKINDC